MGKFGKKILAGLMEYAESLAEREAKGEEPMSKTTAELIQETIGVLEKTLDAVTYLAGDKDSVYVGINKAIGNLDQAKARIVESNGFPRVER